MEPTITVTLITAITAVGVVATVIGGLGGALLTALLKSNKDEVARAKLQSHEEECGRRWETMQRYIENEFKAVRDGVEGLYKRGWWR